MKQQNTNRGFEVRNQVVLKKDWEKYINKEVENPKRILFYLKPNKVYTIERYIKDWAGRIFLEECLDYNFDINIFEGRDPLDYI